jgi:hypothetical protein
MRLIYIGHGINQYPNVDNGGSNLSKCVDDVKRVSSTLKKFGFEPFSYFDWQCTKADVLNHWKTSVSMVKPDEKALIVWHNSSHGTQVPTKDPNEPDGMDEAICCHDTKWGRDRFDGVIIDDEIKAILNTISENITIEFICDSCNSGDLTRGFVPRPIKNRKFLYPRNYKTGKIVRSLSDGFLELSSRHILLAGTAPNKFSYEDASGGLLSTNISKVIESTLPYLPTRREAIAYIIRAIKDKGYDQPAHYEAKPEAMSWCAFSLDNSKVSPSNQGNWFTRMIRKLWMIIF